MGPLTNLKIIPIEQLRTLLPNVLQGPGTSASPGRNLGLEAPPHNLHLTRPLDDPHTEYSFRSMGPGNQDYPGSEACLFDIDQPFYFGNEKQKPIEVKQLPS